MLVLTRRIKESIVLYLSDGQQINFKLLDIGDSRIKIGIEAPADVNITRKELLLRSCNEVNNNNQDFIS